MPGNEVTIEEMEVIAKPAETKPDIGSSKLESDNVPEALRGRSVDDLIKMNQALQDSLRLSEDARISLRSAASNVTDHREEVVEEVHEDDKITREEFEELFKTEPLKAMEIYERRMGRSLAKHLDGRFGPLVNGAISQQESAARAKYAAEFELFEDQIEEVKKQVRPDVLSTAKGWKDMIAYVRGQDDNFDKLVQHKAGNTARNARENQRESTGFSSGRTTRNSTPITDDGELDDVQKKIAESMGMTPEEYKKWM